MHTLVGMTNSLIRLSNLLRVAMVLCTSSLVLAQGPAPSPTTIKGRNTAQLSTQGQNRVTVALASLAAIGHPEIGQDVQNGTVTIVESNQAGLAGTSDFDTIAVETEGMTPEAIAATIFHEYVHVLNDRGAGTEFDPTTARENQPTGVCNHAAIAAFTAQIMCLLSFENPTMACTEVDTFVEAALDYMDACYDYGGSCSCTLPDPGQDCGCHQ